MGPGDEAGQQDWPQDSAPSSSDIQDTLGDVIRAMGKGKRSRRSGSEESSSWNDDAIREGVFFGGVDKGADAEGDHEFVSRNEIQEAGTLWKSCARAHRAQSSQILCSSPSAIGQWTASKSRYCARRVVRLVLSYQTQCCRPSATSHGFAESIHVGGGLCGRAVAEWA